mgnify:CR=1 FL=1
MQKLWNSLRIPGDEKILCLNIGWTVEGRRGPFPFGRGPDCADRFRAKTRSRDSASSGQTVQGGDPTRVLLFPLRRFRYNSSVIGRLFARIEETNCTSRSRAAPMHRNMLVAGRRFLE